MTNSEAIILAREVLKRVPDTGSPDVTLGLFETIARQPDLFIRYRALGANENLNREIHQAVQLLLKRQADGDYPVPEGRGGGLIKSYTRLK